jgi:quercetin dioxygenase-like cupin family protein
MKNNDRTKARKKSRGELQAKDTWYPRLMKDLEKMNRRAETGKIVVRASETPWMQNRNAKVRYYFMPYKTDTALQTMQAFEHVIHRHSGKHRHQGGLAIFVLEGAGYTVVDGNRYDWKAGDLILLPIKPGGVSHQHFNADPKKPARWLALITNTYRPHLGYEIVQIEDSPDWKGSWEKSVKI